MPRYVLTTRPQADAARDIAWLEKNNITAISAPMLDIRPLDVSLPDADGFDAVVLTSRHAAHMLQGSALTDLPCYCVGATTARQAEAAGFTDITTGAGDGAGLVETIIKSDVHHLFWPSAVDTGFNIAAALAAHGCEVERLAVYKAAEVDTFPDAVRDALARGEVAVVLAHSGRAGAHFTHMMTAAGLGEQLRQMQMIAISHRAAGLCSEDWHTITVVDQPRRTAMLEAAMTAIRRLADEG